MISNEQWRRNEFKSRGHTSGALSRRFFFVTPLHFFGSTNTISRFGERFRNGQYSLVSLLFSVLLSSVLLLTVHPCPAICKSGGHEPPVPYGVGAGGNE